MKFAEHLGAHITPEWRKQYIQYEDMKVRFVLKFLFFVCKSIAYTENHIFNVSICSVYKCFINNIILVFLDNSCF